PLALDDKAAGLLTPEARGMIGELIPALERVEPWTTSSVEETVRTFAETSGRKLGAVAQPLRAALTGRTTSPGIFDVLGGVGKGGKGGALRGPGGAVGRFGVRDGNRGINRGGGAGVQLGGPRGMGYAR